MLGGNKDERKKIAEEAYGHFMDFVGTLLPNYHTRQDVFEADLLWRYLHEELEDDEDIEHCEGLCEGDRKVALRYLVALESSFAYECLNEFYQKYFE